jgi:hypothetical protein
VDATNGADGGRAEKIQKIVVAHGGVTVHSVSPPGITMTGRTVTWYADRNLIAAQGSVHLVQKDPATSRVTAHGQAEYVEFDTGLQTFYIPGSAAGRAEDTQMRATAPGSIRRATTVVAAALAAAVPAATHAQIAHSASSGHRIKAYRRARQAGQQPAQSSFTFGDITLTNYDSLKGGFAAGSTVTAVGANVTVTATDPETGAVSQLLAHRIVATMGQSQAVEKVEAEGAVRFSGRRPATTAKGTLVFNGSGSTGVWYKPRGVVELTGPVEYYAEQPSASGKGNQWVRGTCRQATYDEHKQVLTLVGEVRAKVFDPEAMKPNTPAPVSADRVILDLSGPSIKFDLQNNTPEGGRVELHPNVEQQKKKP